jgi:hypothetical protein
MRINQYSLIRIVIEFMRKNSPKNIFEGLKEYREERKELHKDNKKRKEIDLEKERKKFYKKIIKY